MIDKTSTNKARALYYGLLSKLLVYSTATDRFAGVDDALAIIGTNPLDDHSGAAAQRLLLVLDTHGTEALTQEYDALFHAFVGKVIRTSASYYDEGIEAGKKLVEVRGFIAKTKIRRNEATFKDNEDTLPFLLSFMHELVELSSAGHKEYDTIQHCLFEQIINPFVDDVIEGLFNHDKSDAYKEVAILLNAFMEFERLYFEVPKLPKKEAKKTKQELADEQEMQRRAANKAKRDAQSSACESGACGM
ncbi:MAG: molecular chaperone TorD family protein [Campylobacterales bacterium]|nr:molecular chaperone TorD family protein [Campylobacterales bacterium]